MGGILVLVLFALLALASANGCETSIGGADDDPDFDFGLSDDDVDGGDELPICDGVVVVESASGTVEVPGETELFGTSASATCRLAEGQGDEEAVAVLQHALAQCNRQAVEIDGEYGPQTARAVMEVQRQAGVAAEGEYGPVTLQAMRWPTTGTSGAIDCGAGVSQVATVDEAPSRLPPTR